MAYEFIERMDMGSEDLNGVLEHWNRYLSVLEFCRGKDVLDAACGTGYGSSLLAREARSVIGLDISNDVIQKASVEYPRTNLKFRVGNVTEMPLPESSIDVVLSFETIEHIPFESQRAFLKEVKRVLRPNGFFIVSTPCHEKSAENVHGNPFHLGEMELPVFKKILSQEFPCVEIYTQRIALSSSILAGSTSPDYYVLQRGTRGWCASKNMKDRALPDYYLAVCGARKTDAIRCSMVVDDKNRFFAQVYDNGVNDGVKSVNAQNQQKIDNMVACCQQAERNYRETEALYKSAQVALADERKAREELTADYRALEGAFAERSAALADERKAREELTTDYRALEGAFAERSAALADERKAREELTTDYRALEGAFAERSAALADERKAREELTADYRALEGAFAERSAALADERKAREELTTDYRALEGAFAERSAALADERKAREELTTDYRALEGAFAERSAALADERKAREELTVDYRALESLFCNMRVRAAQVERELSDIKGGYCWRITSPLRKSKKLVLYIQGKMDELRSRLRQRREHMRLVSSLKHCELIIDHNLGGGANVYRCRYVEDRLKEGIPCIVAHNNLWFYESRDYSLKVYSLKQKEPIDLHFSTWADCEQWLMGISISRIVYNNLVYNPSVARVLKFIVSSRAPLLLLMHDFFPICPFYNLIDSNGTYCQAKGSCEACIKAHPDKRHLLNMDVHADTWKKMWEPIFQRATEIRIFSPFAAELIRQFYPEALAQIRCVPHSMAYFQATPVALDKGNGLALGVVGNIYNDSKGIKVVEDLARLLMPQKVVVIGSYAGPMCENVVVTGQFKRDDIPRLLKSHGVNIVLFPSIWPETFSFTVSELMMMHLPVVAFDIGAQGDKLRNYDYGALAPEVSAKSILTTASQLYQKVYGGNK